LDNTQTFVIDEQKRILGEFHSLRPLHHLRFFALDRDLIGVANYGVLQRQHINGDAVWVETLLNSVGDVAVTGDGRLSYLASYSHGLQVYDGEGYSRASYVVQGSPSRVSTSFDGSTIFVATQENFLYRLNPKGQLHWAAEAPESITRLHSDPLGQGFVCGFESGRVMRFDWPS
jgi:outer membrane protein assembly factor BamB